MICTMQVWAHPTTSMQCDWLGERVATVDINRAINNVIVNKEDAGWGPNAVFRFPLEGGTGAIWKGVSRLLPKDKQVQPSCAGCSGSTLSRPPACLPTVLRLSACCGWPGAGCSSSMRACTQGCAVLGLGQGLSRFRAVDSVGHLSVRVELQVRPQNKQLKRLHADMSHSRCTDVALAGCALGRCTAVQQVPDCHS